MRRLPLILLCLVSLAGAAAARSPFELLGTVEEVMRGAGPARGHQLLGRASGAQSQLTVGEVRRLQAALRALGYYSGPVDGSAGAGTRDSVAGWARDRGWTPPASLRIEHLKALEAEVAQRGAAPSPSQAPAEAPDADLVRRVRTALSTLGYLRETPGADAQAATDAALAAWAADRGWKAPTRLRPTHAENMEAEIAQRGLAPAAPAAGGDAVVARAQAALGRLGYYSGAADGRSSPALEAAVAAWARDRGWAAPATLREAHAANMEQEAGASASPAVAAAAGPRWQAKSGRFGEICQPGTYGESCLGLACDAESGLVLDFGGDTERGQASLSVDGGAGSKHSFVGFRKRVSLTDPLADRMTAGRAIRVTDGDHDATHSLAGFGETYRWLKPRCEGYLARLRSGEDPFGGRFARLADESADKPARPAQTRWTALDGMDIAAPDLRSGLTDPLLRDLAEGDCMSICLEAGGCRSFTFNPQGGVCFLKSEPGRPTPFAGAKSGRFEVASDRLPPTPGPGPVVDGRVAWRSDDRLEDFQERVREAARPLGGACEAERASLRRLAGSLRWSLPPPDAGRVGAKLRVDWSGNDLAERIPVWLVVSAPQPIRLSGRGHVALGPDAPNPFGIRAGLGRTRALVSLATRGAGTDGAVELSPLRSGPLDLEVALVGYLRTCAEEVVLKSEGIPLAVAPAPAEIVLNTAEGRAAFTRAIEVADASRRIILNETRFLLLDTAGGTEIVERAGTRLRVSPTHRFLAVDSNGRTDIVDLMDGRTAATLADGDLSWGLGDSVVVTTRAPWGKVDMASTFGDHLRVADQLTGPACCLPTPGIARISVDIENATYSIVGGYGYRVGSLQNSGYASIANSGGAYSAEGGETIPLHLQTLASLGLVSPVSLTRSHDTAGGFVPTGLSVYATLDEAEEALVRRMPDRLTRDLESVGLAARPIDEAERLAGDPRLANAGNSRPVGEILPEQLLRLGIALDPMTAGERLVEPKPPGPDDLTIASDRDGRLERSAGAMGRFRKEAKAEGWRFEWALPEGDDGTLKDCGHLLFDSGEAGGKLLAPRDVVQVSRVETGRGALWVARASCTGGATLGTLRPYAALYVMDLGAPAPTKPDGLMLEGSFFYENNDQRVWYEHPFRIKANDERMVLFAPGNGVIMVRDRDTGATLWLGENLPNGDLLVDAWLTVDRRHAVQLNSDGNFYLHELKTDGALRLAGRITDDEVAVWTRDYFYDSTAEAAALISLKFPGKAGEYSLDRFGTGRRAPNLARTVLGGAAPAGAEVGVPPDLAGEVTLDPQGRVTAALRLDPARAKRLTVLQDGVVTQTIEDGLDASERLSFERLKDARWVSIVASDAAGLTSLPVTADLGPPPRGQAVTRVLAIGVNTYQKGGLRSLNYPLRDAGRVMETLAAAEPGRPGFAAEAAPKDRRATPEAIIEATERLLRGLGPGDHAVLFLAGHGLQDADGRFYFATSNTDPADLKGTALPFDRLERLFQSTQSRITVLLDACHSGAAGVGAFATNDELANRLAGLRSNITVLAAAKGRQQSEGRREVGGLFTDAIATVVGSERARYDTNRNGRIEASELYRGVKERVVKASDGRQTPWIIGSRMVGDYALF